MTGPMACVGAIQAAYPDLDDDAVETILSDIVKRARKARGADPLPGDEEVIRKAAAELSEREKIEAALEKRARAINALRRQERQVTYGLRPGKEAEALSMINVGREGMGQGSARSVDAERAALESGLIGSMVAELRAAGLLEVFRRREPAFERDLAAEMWIRTDTELRNPVGTGNLNAARTADILVKYQEAARLMQNEAGAWITRYPGWFVRQSHDQIKVARAGYDAWKAEILPRLDPRTFDDVVDPEHWLNAVWNNIASGNHLKSHGAGDWLDGGPRPGSLAARISAQRKLHFKSPDDWWAYNERFGTGSLVEGILHGLTTAARNTALMRTWGTNPQAAFEADRRALILAAKERGDLKQVRKLDGWLRQAEFDAVSGALSAPADPRLAMVSQTARNIENMAKLGGVALSSLPDIALRAASLRHHGVGLLEAYGDSLKSLLRGRGSGETREVADLIGVGIDGMVGSILARFTATDNVPGRMTKLMDSFFRLSGLQWWTDAHMTGVGLMLSHNLARRAGAGFAELPEPLQRSLARYGIAQPEWDVIRQAATKVADGRTYLTPDAVRLLPDDAIRGYLGKTDATEADLRRARTDLETGLRAYFVGTTDEAMTFPTARERALLSLGTKAGEPAGEAVRFIMQFKTFPVTMITRHYSREFRRGGGVDKFGLAHLIAATFVLGYLSTANKDLSRGRTPRDPTDPKTWIAAFVQGGGAGIYGDFLFGQYNRFGGGGIETLAGPAFGTAGDWLRILGALREGDDPSAQAVRAAVNITPFANLFYTRMALDYLVLYQVQEMLNPGYLRRFERKVREQNAQDFLLSPARAIPHGGGGRLFEGVR